MFATYLEFPERWVGLRIFLGRVTIIHQSEVKSGGHLPSHKYPPLSPTLRWLIIVLVYTTQAEYSADQTFGLFLTILQQMHKIKSGNLAVQYALSCA